MPAVRSRDRADDAGVKPRSDAYVGLLGLSLLALSAAMLFAFLNWQGISEKPPKVQVAPVGGPPRAPAGGPVMNPPGAPAQPGAPGQPAAPPGAQPQPGGKAPPPAPAPAPPQKK